MALRPTLVAPLTFAGFAAFAGSLAAQELPQSGSAVLTATVVPGGATSELRVHLGGAAGPAFLWMVSTDAPGGAVSPTWHAVDAAPISSDGVGFDALSVPTASLHAVQPLYVRAVFLDADVLVESAPTTFPDLLEEPLGDPLDFDWGLGGVSLAAGTVISDTQPWGAFMTVGAVNADPGHPSKVVLYDSGAPGGTDPDLATPGTGPGNDEALGMLLVIAANDDDGNGDDLVDVPDAEDAGGTVVFDLAGPGTVFFLQLVDVDEGATVRWYQDGEVVGTEPVPPGAPGGVWETSGSFAVTRVEVDLLGSAGIGGMTIYPCETVINFDELSTGTPVDVEAGALLAGGSDSSASSAFFGDLLVFFEADNANPEHPDAAVLFDTAAPTGGDDDLATPGPGPGNDAPLGKVLVLAEDVADANGDGLVDDPDDEYAGGVIALGWFTSCGRFRGATVVDVDGDEGSWIEVHLDVGGVEVIPLEALGDNSVQTVTADIGPTRHVEFHLGGSAAIAEIRICPQP